MTSNLKDRLKKIQELKKIELSHEESPLKKPTHEESTGDYSALIDKGWKACGYKVLKREVINNMPFNLKNALPQAAAIIIPDLADTILSDVQDFIFFDLETSGLSGGAGTIAFLAAFGRLLSNEEPRGKPRGVFVGEEIYYTGGVPPPPNRKILMTQYLLLDYPGENDFLDAVLKEFENKNSVIVTYNGKCFDSQILKTRCLMNGIKPPQYFHADLLHPARRLWKNIIHDCSQSSVETKITGIDRSGDIPGSLAPEIWFEFLKTGKTDRLTGICEHNCADISGLASILAAMISIAEDPFGSDYSYDIDRIALYWRDFCRRQNNVDLRVTGEKLLHFAANSNYNYSPNKKAAVFRALAIDSERRLKNTALAIEFVKRGLKLKEAGQFWKEDFEYRLERLKRTLKI